MSDVFISYSRKDTDFVHRLHDALKAKGRDVWVDWEDIPPAADFPKEILANLEAAQNFVFVLSPDSITSTWCGQELAHAVETHKRLLPIVWRNVAPTISPESLRTLNWIFFREGDDFDAALDALLKAIDTDL